MSTNKIAPVFKISLKLKPEALKLLKPEALKLIKPETLKLIKPETLKLIKPEALKSNIHGYIRGDVNIIIPNRGAVEELFRNFLFPLLRERSLFSAFPGWQVGYSGFTYHISGKESLIKFVKNQEEHHKSVSFKDELIILLNEHGVDYKEEYLFS